MRNRVRIIFRMELGLRSELGLGWSRGLHRGWCRIWTNSELRFGMDLGLGSDLKLGLEVALGISVRC